MFATQRKCDLVELCRRRGLHSGKLTKAQLIAQLKDADRGEEEEEPSYRGHLDPIGQQGIGPAKLTPQPGIVPPTLGLCGAQAAGLGERDKTETAGGVLQFAPAGPSYAPGDSVTLNCSEGYRPSPPVIQCVRNGSQAVWSETPTCRGVCTTAGNWPPSVSAASPRTEFAIGEKVRVTCRREQYEGRPAWVRCTETAGRVEWDTSRVSCVEKCKAPDTRDSRVRFALEQQFYSPGDSVTWSCPAGHRPSQPDIRCTRQGNQSVWSGTAACTGVCMRAGNWPPSVSAASTQTEFAVGEKVWVTCRQEQYEGRPGYMRCTETAGRVEWDMGYVSCVEKCPRPQWDPRLRFVPDQLLYGWTEETTLSCPEGFQASLSVIRCVRWGQTQSHWSVWDWGAWRRITENVTCAETPRITPGALEISPTTIKLRWTCEPPESCQGSWKIQAQCRQDGPLSGPCRRQELTSEQPLQGRDGTVTCSSLHPFTSYRVTISGGYPATRPPSTVLSSQRVNTSEAAPDQPEIEPLDPSTKTLRWKQLPPCKGAIVGYQLNITAWREYDSDFLEVEELRVNQSVTKYLLQPWRHGTNYTVTIQGLTAAGLGQASRWDFETNISGGDQAPSPARPQPLVPPITGTCRREGVWTTKVKFPSEQTEFRVNDTVLVTCAEEPEPGPFPAKCTELKDRGAVWDISGVKCLRMCNDWVRQVDFDPAQTEFGVGAEGRVTCHQQFQQNSFRVTCRETEPGLFEWDWGAHQCVRKCEIPRTWDSRLKFAPKRQFYTPGDLVTLSCSEGYQPSPPVIVCARNGSQPVWSETPTCQQGAAQTRNTVLPTAQGADWSALALPTAALSVCTE
ncbi:uncharacterized protein LOC120407969 [Mauremys reevesii]|uniref:uncharacterized protein LOC120407969 n=1 Tax=Mauremys reevesii TaxID=260615 RepID=UPI00193F59A0|nr:uncharacterized protein LOC120407969 [Mauremys reevesii]